MVICAVIICATWAVMTILRDKARQSKRVTSQQVTDAVMSWLVDDAPEMETPYELFDKIDKLWER